MHCEVLACTDQTRLRGPASLAGKTAEAMVNIKQARIALHVVAVLMAVTAVATAFQNSHSCSNRPTLGFVGPSIAPGLVATRSDAAAAAAAAIKCGLAKTPAAQQQSTSAESPLARRMLLRKARSRPTTASTTTASPRRQHREAEERTAEKGGGDVGDLFRLAPLPPPAKQRVCTECSCMSLVVVVVLLLEKCTYKNNAISEVPSVELTADVF